jgi:hypothetical protein
MSSPTGDKTHAHAHAQTAVIEKRNTPATFAITGLCPGSKGGFQCSRHQYAAGGGRASLAHSPVLGVVAMVLR